MNADKQIIPRLFAVVGVQYQATSRRRKYCSLRNLTTTLQDLIQWYHGVCYAAGVQEDIPRQWRKFYSEGVMNQPVISNTEQVEDRAEEAGLTLGDRVLDLLWLGSRHVALLAAWVAMCGSLFFSQVLGWPPCELCWYQRILMYPLAAILGVGIVRRDRGVHLYVLPLSLLGIPIALYHHLLITTDWFPPPSCSSGVPCNVDYLNWFGFITIPFLALIAFVIIAVAMIVWALLQPADTAEETAEGQAPAVPAGLGLDRLVALMIVVGVVLSFLVGSTFV
jgi:disulfide bond formation protein DsbB